jgi:hypothetical protein
MMVNLSDGGRMELQPDGSIVRYDGRGRPVETMKPGDSVYEYWLGSVETYGTKDGAQPHRQGPPG